MKLPSDPDELYIHVIEPLFEPLNKTPVDWKQVRARLPTGAVTTEHVDRLVVDGAAIHHGSLVINNGLELAGSAMLLVLGDLTITGGALSAPGAYSLILANSITVDRLHTSGDVIAFSTIKADLWWGSYNDHSTYTPQLTAQTYIVSDGRSDIIDQLSAKTKLADFELGDAQEIPKLDPGDDRSLRAFLGLTEVKVTLGTASPDEREALRSELAAALEIEDRIAKVKAIRVVYNQIKKRRLADLGDLLVDVIKLKVAPGSDWSLQDELELLAHLKRVDLLESLASMNLRGYENWIPGLVERARR